MDQAESHFGLQGSRMLQGVIRPASLCKTHKSGGWLSLENFQQEPSCGPGPDASVACLEPSGLVTSLDGGQDRPPGPGSWKPEPGNLPEAPGSFPEVSGNFPEASGSVEIQDFSTGK